jgi:hypothetical protein
LKPSRPTTYINNAAERSDGIGPVQNIAPNCGVLHNDTRRHDHIFGGASQLLQDQIHHLPQWRVFVLEKLGDSEEEGGGFIRRELLPGEHEDSDLRE